ncbi:uncharacterized protein LOC110907675 [Helianthus annuus]|uniref:uncharacterized protein LOC110907675 n=1 Tax=Helianthus annuus TaxID=4232 RepID=UPI000B8FAF78|nr:uncharacterized protein LOC110907675 [Helianthus annuus]
MADDLPPLWFPPMSSDDSSDSSILFFQNLIEEAELQDTGTSNRRRYIERQREEGHEKLMADYFVEDPKYNEDIFRHRFRMSKRLFLQIVSDVEENDPWFVEAPDARGRKGFTPLQKVTSAIKQLATGNTPDENDEYLHMAERTSRECLEYFCDTVCKIYGPEFLRRPTSHDMALLYQAHEEKHHLPEYRGQYMRGDHRYPTIMLEAVASQDLWFWHAFAGPPGSQNDINSIPYPHEVNEKKFKRQHEAARKDVERAFGVLKGKWGVLSRPMRARSVKKIRNVVYTCIILHNMILKDDGKAIAPVHIRDPPVEPALDDTVLGELLNEDTHWRLKHDLIDHLASQDLPHLLADSDED